MQRHSRYLMAVDIQTMSTLQVYQPPLVGLNSNFSMRPADHSFLYHHLTISRSPNSEGMSKALFATPRRTHADPYANRRRRFERGR
jgi:hypothetical protein